MGNRIYLDKFSGNNDFKFFKELTSNKELMEMNYGRIFTDIESQKCYKRITANNKNHDNLGSFKVFELESNNFIGMGAILAYNTNSEADIEYSLLPQYWHKGYGTEIAQHLLDLVKNMTSINVVTATIDPNNIGSRKILLKLGFKHVKSNKIDDGSLAEDFVLNIR